MNNKITNQMVSNRQKKKRLFVRTLVMTLFMALFTQFAQAQTNVYMHSGTQNVTGTLNFYDSGGASSVNGSYYWEKWYQHNENATIVFKNGTSPIQVTFGKFHAWGDSADGNSVVDLGEFSLRINNDHLYVYDGENADDEKLICDLTGTLTEPFTLSANGPITFKFVSDGQYRDEGWAATVTSPSTYTVQQPIITKETCSDYVILYNTAYGATVYYSTDNNDPDPFDPLSDATVYTAPFAIDLDAASASVLVRAIAVANGTHSAVASHTFTHSDQRPTPGAPVITIDGNTVTFVPDAVPAGLNETYNIRYTTNGTDPSATNGTLLTKSTGFSINWTTPNTTFKAVTVAVTCSSKVSSVTTETFGNVTVPTPTITFDNQGQATITCSLDGATIYYTTDGTQPTATHYTGTGTTPVTTAALPIGTTVYAYAVFNAEGYDDSSVGSAIYVPESGSGTYGGVVFLDDREPHTLSYYTEDSPIHSLNPRDVKITYYGNSPAGRTTMTTASENGNTPTTFSATATGVKVGIASGETQDQFIYLKTLEAANENGSGNYPYTMIANPFQVRPKAADATGTITYTTYDKVTSAPSDWSGDYLLVYQSGGYAFDGTYDYSGWGNSTSVSISNNSISNPGNAVVLSLVKTGDYYFIKNGNNNIGYTNSGLVESTATSDAYQWTVTINNGYTRIRNRSNNSYYFYYSTYYDQFYVTNSTGNINVNLFKATEHTTTGTIPGWRGFYAWRVKSLSDGLTITDADENTFGVNSIIYADQEIEFVTAKAKGNEVEFEALWAQAYLTTSNSTSGLVSAVGYERNFMVLNNASGTSVSGLTVPCTVSAYYPNGTNGSTTSFISGSITCGADLKIENIRVNGNNSTMTAAGHDLIIGRGVTAYSTRCAAVVQGLSATTSNNLDYTIRLESGTYTDLSCLNGVYDSYNSITCSGNNIHVNTILGSDYDRAKNDNAKLLINENNTDIEFGSAVTLSNVSTSSNTLFFNVKSGTIGRTGLEKAEYGIYLGISRQSESHVGVRKLLVEGGNISNIAGGVDAANSAAATSLYIRMTGGTVRGAIYGSGAFAAASGNRQMVFTGGKVGGWIAAGCNGTSTTQSGGVLPSDTYVYVGDDTEVGNKDGSTPPTINTSVGGNVFGAGSGNTTYETTGQVNNATVVVADSCYVQNNVFGGGNYGYTSETANVHVLGGTVGGSVFGGSNQKLGNVTNITMKDGKVTGNIYGGSNITGTVSGLATINVSGGEVTNVFGGGCGSGTIMSSGTKVTVSGGTINNNVYGGGEEGTVTGNTEVTFSGGTVNDIYGAGKGSSSQRANITGSTTVAVKGGTVNGSVYGGGQNGTVAYADGGANNTNYKSTVGVSGGEVKGNVYGGGKMGTSQVATFVNISDGIIRGHVFGGAEGEQKKVFVTGMRTVNMTGGHVYGNVYGGSQNANDGNNTTLTDGEFATSTTTTTMCVTNISGGIIDENVYAAGFFGNCFGSVYVFLGKDAIEKAPYKQPTTGIDYKVGTLSITGTVWAGGDWGTFSGTFGTGTISGNSNVYVDGNGYETTTQQASNAQYMNIGGSILACGTSCHAGKAERTVIIRNYGTAQGAQPTEASRTLYSIQFAKVLIFDNSNINFTGQGRANQLNQTEKYSLYEIYDDTKTANADTDVDGVRIVNGSGLFLNAPVTQIANFRSMSCDNTFASTTPTLNGYTAITPETLSSCNNQVRVNNGNYIEIKWGSNYGALIGYAHMMSSNNDADATCAYARPRWETNASFGQGSGTDNPNDGGWISYTAAENTFALDGSNGEGITGVQMPYENHTVRNGEQYFRIWRQGGTEHYREGIFNAHASGTDVWKTVDVVITLPAFRDPNNYYCFETNGDATTIDYGADVLMWNAARQTGTGNDWMYFNEDTDVQMTGQPQSAVDTTLTEMKKNANVNFGLVILPSTGMAGSDYIICYEADNNLALGTTKFTKSDNTKEPQVRFRLTYYDKLSSNMTWDPSSIVLVQKDAQGKVVDRVTISLAVNTSSTIEQVFTTQVYAIMQGKGSTSETFNAKVVLPSFAANLYATGVEANFKLNSVNFEAANGGNLIARGGTYDYNNYAVGYAAGFNYDNSDGWNGDGNYTEQDAKPMTATSPTATSIGKTGGRTAFAIDFTLHYDGSQTASKEELIGTLTFNFTFDNYKNAQGQLVNNQPLTIVVEVYRRGQGTRFYIDGINGSNANDARHPDKAVKQLSTIFNRCGYMAGDEIYIVNQVTADKQLDWNGLPYNNVTIYRYNGGHELSATDASIVGNPNNTAYQGNLLNVKNHMTMEGITLDGYYNNGETTYIAPDPETDEDTEYSTDPNGGPHTVTATASMVTIAQGGTLELSTGTVLFNNNSSSVNGAAVNVANGGKLMMNQDATIKENVTTGDGAGVYMAGTMVVSDAIQIVNNKKGDAQNNVFLTAADKMITIGTASASDAYGELSADAKIGVTKGLSADIDDTYTRVVNVDQDVEWLETPFNSNPNSIIYHDGQKYQLVKYTDSKILYWVGTWVTLQDHVPTAEEGGWTWNGTDANIDIETEYQYAWVISIVNGENGQTGNSLEGKTINILADIDMDESIWVPIGTDAHPFKGTINGNGHLIENMHSSLVQDYMGMLGLAENATVENMMALVEFKANSANMGSVAGVVKGSTSISNVEAAGTLQGGGSTVNMGSIVGDVQSGTIHSSFAVCDLKGTTETVMGGLVGTNGGNLYNSYANVNMEGSNTMGGLVGENKVGFNVENCYVNLGQMEIPAFAYTNKGAITYCYASKAGQYVSSAVTDNVAPTKSGIFAAVKGRKELGYMYGDNLVTAPAENAYANHENHEYLNNHTVVWNGLLSVLNQWVANGHTSYSSWYRPTSQDINGDLPVLAFPMDNCLGNFAEEDGKFLRYSASDKIVEGAQANNGLDNLLTYYSGKAANIFLYNSAIGVKNGSGNANLFIHEDAALLQAEANNGGKAIETIKAIVGVTFDNSDHGQNSTDYFGNKLNYDWHLMSSPLTAAPLDIHYADNDSHNWWENQSTDFGQADELVNTYLPNMVRNGNTWPVEWDFYTYFEPQYHWVNFKRNSASHFHYDEPHSVQIDYTNETTMPAGKGYMVAINQDSYLNNMGTLNNKDVEVTLTHTASDEGNDPSKDYGWNLVGNPYQAYLDIAKLGKTVYGYDADNGVYAPYVSEASENPAILSQYIHPHQAFFVYTESGEKMTFDYDQMASATSLNTSYFRGEVPVNYPVVNLFVENEAGNRDLAIVELNRPELGGAYKVQGLRNANFKLYAHLEGKNYGLVFAPEGTQKVPVHFRTMEDGKFTLTWQTLHATFTNLVLVDNLTGVRCNMLTNDHYTFEGSVDDYAARFFITFNVTDVDELNGENGDFAWFDGNDWIVTGNGQIDVIDVMGRVLQSQRVSGEQVRLHLDGVAAGVYMMRLTEGNRAKTQKIVIR